MTGTDRRTPEALPDRLTARQLARRVVQLAVLLAAVALVITALPGLGDVRTRFAHARPLWLVASALLELMSCLAYVVAFRGVFCRRLGWRFSYQVGMAEQAVNVLVPVGGVGGLALGAWTLRQGGMSARRIARRSVAFFVLTSAPNFLCAAVFGVALLVAAPMVPAPAWLTAMLACLAWVAIAVVLALPRLIDRRAAHPAGTEGALRGGRARHAIRRGSTTVGEGVRDAIELVGDREPLALLGSIGYLGFDLAALAASFAAFGGAPGPITFVFAYTVGQLGGLIPLPGGIGGTDGGLIGALALYGTPVSQAAAAVLAYRAFQLCLPAILGSFAFVGLRRTLARSEAPAALCEPIDDGDLPVVTLPHHAVP